VPGHFLNMNTTEEKITPVTNPPMMIIFLDLNDLPEVEKELKGIDTKGILAKPLCDVILGGFQLRIEDYDGVTYYSAATLKFLEENRKMYIDVNRKIRRMNAKWMKKILSGKTKKK
jgi:hypothetical protein